jgi:hypothetical protein
MMVEKNWTMLYIGEGPGSDPFKILKLVAIS